MLILIALIDNNVTYDEIIDTNSTNVNIINDIIDDYGDMPVNNENIINTKELANFIEKLCDDYKKDSIDLKNSINSNKKDVLDIKKLLHRPMRLSTYIEKMYNDIKNDSIDLKIVLIQLKKGCRILKKYYIDPRN